MEIQALQEAKADDLKAARRLLEEIPGQSPQPWFACDWTGRCEGNCIEKETISRLSKTELQTDLRPIVFNRRLDRTSKGSWYRVPSRHSHSGPIRPSR